MEQKVKDVGICTVLNVFGAFAEVIDRSKGLIGEKSSITR